MKRTLALAGLVAMAAMVRAAETPTPETVVVRAARLFDGRADALRRDAVVVVRGDRIEAVGSGLAVPAGARVIDLGDTTLLPGFIDAHTHLTGESSQNWYRDAVTRLRRGVPEKAIRATEYARKTLLAGFTTVRDVGAGDFVDVALRNAIQDGVVPGPRMLVAAVTVGSRGGHCDDSGFPYLLFGKESGMAEGVASGPDGFRDAVRFAVKYGADVIKTCATGGVLSLADEVDTAQITQDEMKALVDEAHRLRKRAAAHAHGAEGAKAAIRAGIDSIEHGSFLDDEALRLMKDRGTWLVPTAMAVKFVSSPDREYPEEIAAKARAAADAWRGAFRRAVKSGVKIAFGTDSGVSPHGLNAQEFGLLVANGMRPAGALRAATSGAATLLGVEATVGTLEAGKQADLVAVPGDPLADVTVTERVVFVMRGGRVHRNDIR